MVVVQCSKVGLPYPSSLSPSHTSILFEPSSHSLALTHSDSSISLYPSFSPFSSSSSSSNPNHTQTQTQTLTIPSPSSSSTFLLLHRHHHHHHTLIFIVSSPHPSGILLRLYRLTRRSFAPVPGVVTSHPHLRFHPSIGLLLHAPHGPAVTLAASVNYLALYALSSHRLFLFAVKSHADHDGPLTFVTSAVIHCSRPVFSVALHFGFLVLGHDNGVRVFGLRALVKGRSGNELRDSDPGNVEKHVKQTKIKLKHDDRDGGSCFVVLKENEVKTKSTTKVSMSIKAISIQAVSQRMFLILDSHGDLHLLSLSNSGIGVDITGNVRQLSRFMKVQSIAVLPDISTMSRTIWISDGCHSVHMFTAMDIENALNEADGNDCNKKLVHLPVIRALFSSEKIQDIISLSANSILILGQGSLYAYAIS